MKFSLENKEMYKENTLSAILFRSYSKENITHTDMYNKRSYSVKKEGEFLAAYSRSYSYLSGVGNFHRYLLERTTDVGPVIVDIDLSKKVNLNNDNPKALYTEKQVLVLAKIFQKILNDNLVQPKNLDCFVLEKPGYFKENGGLRRTFKNGFHLHFPHVWLERRERYYINSLVQEKTKFQLDNAVISGNWFMYGSKKSPESEPYLLSYIIEEKRKHVLSTLSAHELIFLLSVRQKSHTNISKLSFTPEVERKISKPFDFESHTPKNENELRELIQKIPENIAENYLSWRAVGCALFNESHGEDFGRDLWLEFSQKCLEKYDQDVCEDFWMKMSETNYSMGTLIFYSRIEKKKTLLIKKKKK